MEIKDFNLKETKPGTYEGEPCENVKAKLVKISDEYWHIYIRDNNPDVKFPIIGSMTNSKENALEFLNNYEGCP